MVSTSLLRLRDCIVDLDGFEVRRGSERLPLTVQEVDILRVLLAAEEHPVSHETLYREVWGYRGTPQGRASTFAVFRLRKKIETDPTEPVHLLTVRSRGFRLVSVLSETDTESAPTPMSPSHRTNVARGWDPFIGRSQELAGLKQLLQEGNRLISVVGTGGVGKTRLCRRLAHHELERFPGGVWMVSLASATNATEILEATASAVQVALGELRGDAVLAAHIGQALQARGHMLLVLDNCEQVAALVASLVSTWRHAAQETVFLVTSRLPLGLDGERLFSLEPLPTADAVRLFESRAKALDPDFAPGDAQVLEAVVEQLDRLPLAVELAAGRARLLSPQDLLDRLGDRFQLLRSPNRRTLRDTIDGSWALLEPWEQSTLAQLSVFRGGFLIESAEAVVSTEPWPQAPWVLDLVEALLDQSLVHRSEGDGAPRFDLYESIRAYASERLDASGQTLEARVRLARHMAAHGDIERFRERDGPGGAGHFRRLVRERENLVASVDAALEADHPDIAAACALAANAVFARLGPFARGAELMERVLAVSGELPADLRGRLLRRLGFFVQSQGGATEAEEHFKESLDLHRSTGSGWLEGTALLSLAGLYKQQGHLPEARSLYEQALDLQRKCGDERSTGIVLGNLGNLLKQQGDQQAAQDCFEQALAIHRGQGNRRSEAVVLGNLANLLRQRGQTERAGVLLSEALTIHREQGNRRHEGSVQGNLGLMLIEEGELDRAEHLLEQGIVICDELLPYAAGAFRAGLARLRALKGDEDGARALLMRGEAQLRDTHAAELGKLLCVRGTLEHGAGNQELASHALEEASAIVGDLGLGSNSELAVAVAALRELLDPPGLP